MIIAVIPSSPILLQTVSRQYHYNQRPSWCFYPLSIFIRSLLIVIVDLVVSIVLSYVRCVVSFKLRTIFEVILVIISFTSLASITPGTVFRLFIIYYSAPFHNWRDHMLLAYFIEPYIFCSCPLRSGSGWLVYFWLKDEAVVSGMIVLYWIAYYVTISGSPKIILAHSSETKS
jgi:hypothetical protein